MLTFNTDGMVAQRFAFPAPVMDYLFKNLQPKHLLKLYQTCKFFYAKFGINFIQNLVIVADDEDESFGPSTTFIRISNPDLQKLKHFWIVDSFVYRVPVNSNFIPYFTQCTIKKLEIWDYIAWEEFVILTKSGTVEEMKIKAILGKPFVFASVEEIVAQVPKATSIQITHSEISETTFATLASLDHQVIISSFILGNILAHNIEPQSIVDFLSNHAANDCIVHFGFKLLTGNAFYADNQSIKEEEYHFNNLIKSFLSEIKKERELARQQQEIMQQLQNA